MRTHTAPALDMHLPVFYTPVCSAEHAPLDAGMLWCSSRILCRLAQRQPRRDIAPLARRLLPASQHARPGLGAPCSHRAAASRQRHHTRYLTRRSAAPPAAAAEGGCTQQAACPPRLQPAATQPARQGTATARKDERARPPCARLRRKAPTAGDRVARPCGGWSLWGWA